VSEVGQKRRSDSAPLSVYPNKKVSELVSSSHDDRAHCADSITEG
jgi:hypothetical protein